MKTLAIMWRDLGPEERQKYIVIAEADKARYFNEMATYTGPMQVPNTRAKKPDDAPKRAISAFLSFSQSMRAEIREKNPTIQNAKLSATLAQLWREASEETKRPHIERESREREKYQEEMVRWKAMETYRTEMEKDQRAHYEAMRNSGASFDPMGKVYHSIPHIAFPCVQSSLDPSLSQCDSIILLYCNFPIYLS